nr:hypothetical protein [uncultured Campylobacter sp.]
MSQRFYNCRYFKANINAYNVSKVSDCYVL